MSKGVFADERGAQPPALAASGLSKSFGGARALDDVSLSILPGEVHGLLGENGSGKSTLIKILAGYHAPDHGGQLSVHGREVHLPLDPGRFRELGLSFVHQDLGLVPSLSVLENLRIDRIAQPRNRWYVSWRRERALARALFAEYGVSIDPGARVGELPQVQRALLAIVRAVAAMRGEGAERQHGVLVLDEPTVFLPRADIEHLFALVREIAATGSSVLFVSHDLDEVREITDRVTVLRDGRVHGTVETARTSEAELVELIIGRRLEALAAPAAAAGPPAPVTHRVSLRGLTGAPLSDVSLDVRGGEVLGLTGLVGSGFDDLPYFLFGARQAQAGELEIDGRRHQLASLTPSRAIAAGIALLPGDRQGEGSAGSLSVLDNLTIGALSEYFNHAWLERRRMRREARPLLNAFDVRPNEPAMTYGSLSGGNQQKVLLAKWMRPEPALLVLHEPTQGVDIGAREQIFSIIREAAERGMSVLCASSDHEQLALVCDRVVVFGRGRPVRELTGSDLTKERIAEQCYGSAAATVMA